MKTMLKRSALCLAVAAALGSSSIAMASDTSSALRGKISTPSGQPAANTKIIITHIPSGTTRELETNDSGSFMAKGLRVGGPYQITVDSDTYKDQQFQDVFLTLGKTKKLNTTLEAHIDIERIEVTAQVPSFASAGGSSYFGEDAIKNTPTFNRDLKEIVRNNPLAVSIPGNDQELSVAGTNPRYNSITVDGIGQNDDFGLNTSGYPTQRSPISIDAIEQLSIETSPFNAKVSNFSGALINAVTKSGTNEMFGSLFYETMNDSLAGTATYDDQGIYKEVELDFEETTFGGTLGGALIKDELFFFVSAESYESPTAVEWGPAGSNAPNQTDITESDLTKVQNIARDVYGVDAGDWDLAPSEEDEKLLVKLDWNINDYHRSSFTYQYNKGNMTRNVTSAPFELRLSSHWYNKEETLNNFALQLYSDWTDEFSTQIGATLKSVETVQAASNLGFGDVKVETESGDVSFGPDQYRHANALENDTLTLNFDAEYLLDDHSISFGYQFKSLEVFNLFVDGSLGVWVFESIEDFENRKASDFNYKNAYTNQVNDGAAEFTRKEHALYVQDEWVATDDLTLTFGMRYEMLNSSDSPTFNQNALDRTGYANTENLDGLGIFLPRFGFNYMFNDELTLRGGIGRYTGGQPTVWVSNGYSNDGVTIVDMDERDAPSVLEGVDITSIPQAAQDALVQGNGSTNFVDPDFNLPNDWRVQLAADYNFESGYNWSNELLYVKKEDAAFWVDASLKDEFKVGTTADGGRSLYNDPTGRTYDIMLTNAEDSGRSIIFSSSLAKNFDNGFNMNMSYTHQDITEANPGTSSTAKSNYRYNVALDRNQPLVGTAAYEIKHRFVLSVGYETELFDGYKTTTNLFFERRSGKPISYVMDGTRVTIDGNRINDPYDLVSPGLTGDYLVPYIPVANDPNVIYSSPEAEAEILAAVQNLGLSGYAGGYLPKNVIRTPWTNTLDFSFQQEIPGFMEDHKGTIYFTIDNLLNLIDSSKGKVFTSQYSNIQLIDGTIDPDTGKYVYDGLGTDNVANWDEFKAEQSTWRLKVGVRYRF
ncbi:TonB-dependent receptor [Flocculibacter collagenilyticus]|uniref:TonB-dependent receptor n=1 Tax=Flocculibacter collagenilyticus TaxID=2744479 RepID=UPI0018F7B738|nr:TonB-dependent receptor [Flocculibacter collagenilyticus]